MHRIRMISIAALIALAPFAAQAQSTIVEEYVKALGGDAAAVNARADKVLAATSEAAGLTDGEYYELVLDIAKSREEAGDKAGAEKAYQRAASFGEKAFGADSLRLRPALQGVARMEAARGDALAAEKTLLKSKAIAEAELGPEHPSTRDELALLATLDLPVKPAPNGEDRRGDYQSSLLRINERSRQTGEIVAQGAGDSENTCESAPETAAEKVVVYYGTNRKKAGGNAPTWFYKNDYDRGAPVKYGVVAVSLPCNREVGTIPTQQIWKLEFRADPAKHVILESVAEMSSETAFWSSAKRRMDRSTRKEALVFIHGFNVDFAGAATRTAQLAADTDLDGAPFFYDWPSKAALGGYNADRTVATEVPQITRDVANFLKGVADKTGAERISVIAHSMGNEPLIRALKLLADEDYKTRTDKPFDEVIFASPDVNVDNFKAHVTATRKLAGNMTLYASEKDRALEYSSWRSDFPRAGFAKEKVVVDGLVSVDTTKASSNFVGHDDFAGNGLDDLRSVIWFGAKPEGRCVLSPLTAPKGIWDFSPKCEDADFKLAVTLLRARGLAQSIADLEATRATAREDTSISAAERNRRVTRAEKIKSLVRQVAAAFNPASLAARYAAVGAAPSQAEIGALVFGAPELRSAAETVATANAKDNPPQTIAHAETLARIDGAGLDEATAAAWRRYAAGYDAASMPWTSGIHVGADGAARSVDKILSAPFAATPPLIEAQASGGDPRAQEWERLDAEAGRLYNSGDFAAATAKAETALRLAEQVFGKDDPSTLLSLSNLAWLYQAQGRYAEAEPLYLRAFEARERVLGKDHPDTLASVNNLATLYLNQGRFSEAEPLLRRALEARARVLGPEHPDTLTSLNNLAALYLVHDRYAEAEPLLIRALEARERILGKEHPDTLGSLTSLAALYLMQGRYAEAEPLFLRVLVAHERVLGPEHPDALASLTNLAALYQAKGRYAEAEPLLRRALETRARVLGPEHPDTLASLNNLGALYLEQDRYAEAEPLLIRALQARERILGKEHPDTLLPLRNLAVLYRAQSRYAEAEPLFRRALDASERVLGKEHLATLNSLQDYFLWRATAGRAGLKSSWAGDSDALRLLRDLLPTVDSYLAGGVDAARLSDPTSVESRAAQLVSAFERARLAGVSDSDVAALREPVFSIVQRFNASAAAKALTASAERLAVTDEARRSLLEDRARAEAGLKSEVATLDALRRLPQRNAEAEAATRARIAPLERRIAEFESALIEKSAADAELLGAARATSVDRQAASTPGPPANSVPIEKQLAQEMLAPVGEALLVYSSVGGRYFAFVKRPSLSTTVSLDVTRDEIERRIAALRKGMRLPFRIVGGKEVSSSDPRDLPAFDLEAAARLHKTLIDPLKPHLQGVEKLIIVADGPLQSLPFGVLVEEAGAASLTAMERYKASTFLIDRYAISVQPSVSALVTLRAAAPRSAGQRPLLGFADPQLKPGAASPGDEIRIGKADEKKALIIPMSGTVDAEKLQDLPALPQTKVLLETVGASFEANPRDLYIGADAQEVDIRFLNEQGRLKNYRMIVFATHGLVSNEIEALDLIEPALVMSLPPVAPGKERPWENDGLLRASDIVGFDMDADLVILAACNTASADGAPGAEPLSGLAKAFMARGARALLVSHWQADANSSAVLIPAMARNAELVGFPLGLAMAQRDLRLSAAFDPDPLSNTLHHAHPAIWGAFTLIGDPGR